MNPPQNDWMISEVVGVPGVRHVVVLSADGLVRTRSQELDQDTADRLAAAASGLMSVGTSLAKTFGRGGKALVQQMTEFEGGFLFVRSAGDGTRLAVVTEDTVNPALIGSQMVLQVKRFGEHQATPARRTRTT
ncbi:roadblock/LC7 domain-containing protein [Streptomyces macrosporus]|uniref:Roadblock/LC7 domain-containing protein n=1 Tax=Streptomyces macrosporus TaxID=44032 RepID=A0ABP5XKP1_9ACTN